jgi:electron-transferring-flavoprotein dehydrogenase
MDHPVMEAEVVIVGAGPAGLACALRLTQLIDDHNARHPGDLIAKDNIYVLEKGREVGAHMLSGAVLDLRALRELLPTGYEEAPIETMVHDDAAFYLTTQAAWKMPITPPPLENVGNAVVSLNRLVKWLGQKVEQAGVTIFTAVAGAELLFSEAGGEATATEVQGVRTDNKGVDKAGHPKANFEPGYDLRAPLVVLTEGPRGSLTKQLLGRLGLRGRNPQVYSLGIKELWEVPSGRFPAGLVYHTLGWPLPPDLYGGGWIYGLPDNRVSIGLVTALEYKDPRTDPHELFQRYKTHPWVRSILEGGEMQRYGAKTTPMGGWYSLPPLAGRGWLLAGDSAGFLNSQRLKGIHLAMKSGMLAAEAIFAARVAGDRALIEEYPAMVERSWIQHELWPVRNFHQGFESGLYRGLMHAALQLATRGRGTREFYATEAGHQRMRTLSELGAASGGGAPAAAGERLRADGKLTFDKLADVYHSGTRHEEDQPSHLLIHDTDICNNRCIREYGNPCQYFCPAAVYEMVATEDGTKRIHLNPSNCVHCKTCDIMDPYEIITWVPPEGGGGPNYEGM